MAEKEASVLATRRQMLAGIAIGGLAVRSTAWGQTPPPTQEAPGTAANQSRTALHQEVVFAASTQRLYQVLLTSKLFAGFTGLAARIDPKPGGAFSLFGGLVGGRNVELITNRRIVQAWRPSLWDAGLYSLVRFELKPQGTGTNLVLDHTAFPEGEFDALTAGWPVRYWEPLKKFLA
jgi:activator of HSP90 ATPase